jgi:Protein of unknown function (DUF1761)
MVQVNYLAVLSSAVAAFVVGGLWYSPVLFGKAYMSLRGLDPNGANAMTLPLGEMVAEFARWLVIGFVLARFMTLLDIANLSSALTFGLWMWLAIYTALAGSVVHEGTRWRLYAIHVGDGLVKILLITAILGLWRAR